MGREESSLLFQKSESDIYRNSFLANLSLQTNMFVDNIDLNDPLTPFSGRYFTRGESCKRTGFTPFMKQQSLDSFSDFKMPIEMKSISQNQPAIQTNKSIPPNPLKPLKSSSTKHNDQKSEEKPQLIKLEKIPSDDLKTPISRVSLRAILKLHILHMLVIHMQGIKLINYNLNQSDYYLFPPL